MCTPREIPEHLREFIPPGGTRTREELKNMNSDSDADSQYSAIGSDSLEKLLNEPQELEERIEQFNPDGASDEEFRLKCFCPPHFCLEGDGSRHTADHHECLSPFAVELLRLHHQRRLDKRAIKDPRSSHDRRKYNNKMYTLETFPELGRLTAEMLGIPCVCRAGKLQKRSSEKKRDRAREERLKREEQLRAEGKRIPRKLTYGQGDYMNTPAFKDYHNFPHSDSDDEDYYKANSAKIGI